MNQKDFRKIVVTGAGGFLGGRLLKHLAEVYPGSLLVGTSRRNDRKEEFEKSNTQFVSGDLLNEIFCNEITKEADIVIHCAALSSPWGNKKMFTEANVLATHNLLNASLSNKVKRFIFISTPSIYFDYRNKWDIKESDPLPSEMVNYYAETKLEAEEFALSKNNKGIETIALRPRAIIGAEDTVIFPRLIRAYREKKLKIIGSGKNRVDLTCVRNVLEAVVCSIKAENSAMGEAYNISNGEPVLLWEKINALLEALNFEPLRERIPAGLAMLVASIMETKAKLFHSDKEPALTKYGIGVLTYSLTMDISKARNLLDYQPVQTTEEGLTEFIKWYRNQPSQK